MEYRKSYAALVVFFILYTAAVTVPALLLADGELATRLTLAIGALGIVALMAFIRHTERVYWINGVTFEQARNAGSARRRAFAMAHLKPFALATLGFCLFSAIMHWRGMPIGWDIAAFCAALVGAGISTLKIRL